MNNGYVWLNTIFENVNDHSDDDHDAVEGVNKPIPFLALLGVG